MSTLTRHHPIMLQYICQQYCQHFYE